MGVNVLCLRRLCKKSVELSLVDQFEEYVAGNRMGEQSKGLALMQKAGISALPHNIWRNDRLPFETESFDIITILDVVEHLPGNPFRVLSEINRLLRKGGLLILGGPNAISLTKRIKLLVGKHPYMPFEEWCKDSYYSHYREYAPAEYAALIERSGLSVERIHLVPEPTRTLARNHYRNGRHRVLSLTSIGLYGLQILDGVFQSIRPSVYCVAVKSRNVKTG